MSILPSPPIYVGKIQTNPPTIDYKTYENKNELTPPDQMRKVTCGDRSIIQIMDSFAVARAAAYDKKGTSDFYFVNID